MYSAIFVKKIFEKNNIRPLKRFGQNFLIDKNICENITNVAGGGEFVIEIGPGLGHLTAELAKKFKKIIAIEIDSKIIPILKDNLCEFNNIEIIHGDALEIDFRKIIGDEKASVCTNLPYYITTPLIARLLENFSEFFKKITVMVQKEAAERLVAPLGSRECGAISALVQYYSKVTKHFAISKKCFFPVPNVDSVLISFEINIENSALIRDKDLFFKIIKAAFLGRRKTLINNLKTLFGRENVENALSTLKIPKNSRAENLTFNDFALISEAI
jgi:16S rRNA (adenine1518-N6/adenine1519-N6)-dimethyltransferase